MKKIFTIAWCIVSALSLTSCQSEAEPTRTVSRADGNVIYLDQLVTRADQATEKFDELIQSGNVFVDFYTDWCPPCRAMSPVIDAVAKQFSNVTFLKVNLETFQSFGKNFKGIPVVRLYKDGRQVYQKAGAIRNAQDMTALLNKYF